MNTPTADEQVEKFTSTFPRYGTYLPSSCSKELKVLMIEFAKLHVEAALKEASKKAEIHTKEIGGGLNIEWKVIDKDSILNAYPLTLIK